MFISAYRSYGLVLSLILFLAFAGCDKPAGSGEPAARSTADVTAQGDPRAANAIPVDWDERRGAFFQRGKRLDSFHIWRFAKNLEGFTAPGAVATVAPSGGLSIENKLYGAFIRTPEKLNIDGARYSTVLVRLTRVTAGAQWEPVVYYTTSTHGESEAFESHVYRGVNPKPGATAILVFNMAKPTTGLHDWVASRIQQFRLQTDDQPGGRFIIREIAVTTALPH